MARPPSRALNGRPPIERIDANALLAASGESEYDKVYDIDLAGRALPKISGLEKFNRLRILDLGCNDIEKIENLSGCTELRELKLYSNKLITMQGLEKLRMLTVLCVSHNAISDLAPIQRLMNLRELRITNNRLTSLAGLPTGLTHLNISSNLLPSLDGIGVLRDLKELVAADNRITDTKPTTSCAKLEEIDLSGNHLSRIAFPAKLKELRLCRCGLVDLARFPVLTELTDFHLSGNRLTQIDDIPRITPNVEILDISLNLLASIEFLSKLQPITTLAELLIKGNPGTEDLRASHQSAMSLLRQLAVVDGAVRAAIEPVTSRPGTARPSTARPSTASGRPSSSRPGTARIASAASSAPVAARASQELTAPMLDMGDVEQQFQKLRSMLQGLAPASVPPAGSSTSRPQTSRGTRSRLEEARMFAAGEKWPETS